MHPCVVAVVASAVNVICELARRNPQNYLGMAPVFYKLLTSLNNNWTLIKIVKLFGALAPLEPRLAKKLVDPIANIINTTQAKSLLYECLNTATVGMKGRKSIVGITVEKLKMFVESPDQNLKYLGLLGLSNLLDKHPLAIAEMRDVILECLEDPDITIRYRAVDLLCGVINKKNVRNIVHRLMRQVKNSETEYKNHLVERIISSCSADNYANVSNFKWYLQILIDMTEVKGIEHGTLIASQMMDVMIRVKSIRSFGVSEMVKLLSASFILGESTATSNIFEVLYAASWTVGEFIRESEEDHKHVIESLMSDTCTMLPARIQACYIQAIAKVYAAAAGQLTAATSSNGQHSDKNGSVDSELAVIDAALNDDTHEHRLQRIMELRTAILGGVEKLWGQSADVEIQERVFTCRNLLELHGELLNENIDAGEQIMSLFSDELNPVAPGSQERVPVPEGLRLDKWIGVPFVASFEEFDEDYKPPEDEYEEDSSDEMFDDAGKSPAAAIDRSMFYIKDKGGRHDPNIKTHDISTLLGKDAEKEAKKLRRKKRQERRRRSKLVDNEEHVVAISGYEAPEGYVPASQKKGKEAAHDPLNVDLSQAVEEDLYRPQAYPTSEETLRKAKEEIERQKQARRERRKKRSEERDVRVDEAGAEKKTKKGKKKSEEASTETKKKKKKVKAKKDDKEEKPKTSKRKKKKKEEVTAEAESSILDLGEPSAPVAKKSKKPKKGPRRKLCNDDNLKVAYNNRVMPTSAHEISIPFIFENVRSEGSISGVCIHFDNSMDIKVVHRATEEESPQNGEQKDAEVEAETKENISDDIDSRAVHATFELAPGGYDTLSVQFAFESVLRPIQLTGNVEYKMDNNGGDIETQVHTVAFNLTLPCSMFIQPKEISMEELGQLIKDNTLPHLASTKIDFPEATEVSKIKDIDTIATEICDLMRMAVVDYAEGMAYTLYGVSVQGHHVAALIKQTDKLHSVQLQIKCSDDVLGNNLLVEISKHAQK